MLVKVTFMIPLKLGIEPIYFGWVDKLAYSWSSKDPKLSWKSEKNKNKNG